MSVYGEILHKKLPVSVFGVGSIQHKKEERLKLVGVPGFFLELLARFVCIFALLGTKIEVRLRQAVVGGARPRRS